MTAKKKTAMQQLHELLNTKNAKDILEKVTEMQAAIQKMATLQPIMLSISINPVTGQPSITSSNLQNPKEDLKKLRVALRTIGDQVTENVIKLAETADEEPDLGEDLPDMPPSPVLQ